MTPLAAPAAALLTAALAAVAPPAGDPAPAGFVDPIRFTGHGAAFGADGRQIVVDAGFIARAQWDPLESTCRHASLSIL